MKKYFFHGFNKNKEGEELKINAGKYTNCESSLFILNIMFKRKKKKDLCDLLRCASFLCCVLRLSLPRTTAHVVCGHFQSFPRILFLAVQIWLQEINYDV